MTVATAGVSSAGHIGIEMIRKYTASTTCMSPTTAAIRGHCDGIRRNPDHHPARVEQADMIRGKKLRPLAVLSEQPLADGYGQIPPITKWIKDFKTGPNYFGIFIPNDVPKEVARHDDALWQKVIFNSAIDQGICHERGAVFPPPSDRKPG